VKAREGRRQRFVAGEAWEFVRRHCQKGAQPLLSRSANRLTESGGGG